MKQVLKLLPFNCLYAFKFSACVLVLIGTMFITSCSEDSLIESSVDDDQINFESAIIHRSDDNCNHFNSNNPFDYYGEYHNLFMDYIAINAMELDSSDLASSINDQMDTFLLNEFPSTLTTEATAFRNELNNDLNFLDNNSNYFDSLPQGEDFLNDAIAAHYEEEAIIDSSEYWLKVDELQKLILDYNSSTVLDDAICEIIEWEDSIDSMGVSQSKKDYLYKVGSIARHSLYYWSTEEDLGDNSIWSENNKLYSKPPWWKRVLNWLAGNGLQIVAFDVAGFYSAGGWYGAGGSSALATVGLLIFT
jgi:hypothetical protein